MLAQLGCYNTQFRSDSNSNKNSDDDCFLSFLFPFFFTGAIWTLISFVQIELETWIINYFCGVPRRPSDGKKRFRWTCR